MPFFLIYLWASQQWTVHWQIWTHGASNPRVHRDALMKPSVLSAGLLVSAWEANRWWHTAGDVFTFSTGAARRAACAHTVTQWCENMDIHVCPSCFTLTPLSGSPLLCRCFMPSKKTRSWIGWIGYESYKSHHELGCHDGFKMFSQTSRGSRRVSLV